MLGRRHLRSKLLVGSVVVVFVLAMGLSRVWLGHHWLTDVIAGWLVGLAWLGRRHGAPGQGHAGPGRASRVTRASAAAGDDGAAGLEPGDGTRNGEHDT